MTIQGGKSYRRQTATLFASAIMLAFTLFAPLSVYAETPLQDTPPEETESQQPGPQAPELPYFTKNEEYRVLATFIELRTNSQVTSVNFISGVEIIPGVENESSDQSYITWRPSAAPTDNEVVTVEVDGKPADNTAIEIVETPTLVPIQLINNQISVRTATKVLSGTKLGITFNGVTNTKDCADICEVDEELTTFSVENVPPGEYSVVLKVISPEGNFPEGTELFVIPQPPVPPATNQRQDDHQGQGTLPVKTSDDLLISKLEVAPVEALSTQFSIPVTSSLLSALKNSGTVQTIQPRPPEVKGAATEELATLDKVVDLGPAEPPTETPLAPTSGGWSLFGVSWYWWAGSAVTAWAAAAGARWWLRKP